MTLSRAWKIFAAIFPPLENVRGTGKAGGHDTARLA